MPKCLQPSARTRVRFRTLANHALQQIIDQLLLFLTSRTLTQANECQVDQRQIRVAQINHCHVILNSSASYCLCKSTPVSTPRVTDGVVTRNRYFGSKREIYCQLAALISRCGCGRLLLPPRQQTRPSSNKEFQVPVCLLVNCQILCLSCMKSEVARLRSGRGAAEARLLRGNRRPCDLIRTASLIKHYHDNYDRNACYYDGDYVHRITP